MSTIATPTSASTELATVCPTFTESEQVSFQGIWRLASCSLGGCRSQAEWHVVEPVFVFA